MFSYAFVVFSFRQNLIVLSVSQYKHRALYSAQELFYNDLCRCVSEHTSEHLLQFLLCLFESRQYEHALSGAQSVSFQHVRCFQRFKEFQSFLKRSAVESPVFCCRYIVSLHESFCKVLRSFEHGAFLRRSYYRNVLCSVVVFEIIVNTFYQRVFRSYNNHVDTFFNAEVLESLKVVSLDVHVFACLRGSSISWCNKKFFYLWALCYFPCQSVFASSAA